MRNSSQYKVVVVGGGVIGLSILYHLTQNGWKDVLLLEKSTLTNGSTWHASGELGLANSDPAHLGFASYSRELYQMLDQKLGGRVGWRNTGGLKLAFNYEEEHQLIEQIKLGQDYGINLRMVSVREASRLHPFLDFDGVKSCLYSSQDGNVDSYSISIALAEQARKSGASIHEGTQVAGIEYSSSGVWYVDVDNGENVTADHVVLAPGCYARQIAEWFDVCLPIYTFLHHYFITDSIPELSAWQGEIPIVRDEDCGGYVRRDADGLLIGTTENKAVQEVWASGVPWHEEGTLFEPDVDSVEHLLNAAIRRFPMISNIGIKTIVRGAVTYTPDSRMFLGSLIPGKNLWIAAGASSGIAWAGGIGACLADLICKFDTRFDMSPFAPDRFRGRELKSLRDASLQAFMKRGSTRVLLSHV